MPDFTEIEENILKLLVTMLNSTHSNIVKKPKKTTQYTGSLLLSC